MRHRASLGGRSPIPRLGLLGAALIVAGALVHAASASPIGYRGEVLADSPSSYWRLGEAGGFVAADERNANPGTYGGGVSLNQTGSLASDTDAAAGFDGIDDFATVPDSASLDATSAVTIELWAKRLLRTNRYEVLVGKPGNFSFKFENYAIWLSSSNSYRAYFGNGSYSISAQTTAVTDTAWHHVVATYDNATARIYLDGVLQEAKTSSVRLTPNASPLNVARAGSTAYFFSGRLDEIAVYPSALSASRVRAHFDAAAAVPGVDNTPPAIGLASPAQGSLWNGASATYSGLAGTADGDLPTVTVKLYSGSSAGGTPSQTLIAARQPDGSYSVSAAIGEGTWTAQAEQADEAGNTGFSSANTFAVDRTAPAVSITSGPQALTNDSNAVFLFAAGEPASFECSVDGASFSTCASPRAYLSLADGTHSFAVRATDPAGNTGSAATHAWQIDTVGPVTSITAGPSQLTNDPDATFTFTADEPASFECRIDGESYAGCSTPQSYQDLADGGHTFAVRATDPAGNSGAAATYDWQIDTLVPDPPTLVSAPADPTSSTEATFTFSSSEPGVTFECSLDSAEFASCTSPQGYQDLADGEHVFRVRARDAAGHVSGASIHTWHVDTSGPAVSIQSGPAELTNSRIANFAFAAEGAAVSLACRLDGAVPVACMSPQSYLALADGVHTFDVRATDALGNTGPAATHTWRVDGTPPPAPIITERPTDPTRSPDAHFAFTDTEAGVSLTCSLDGASSVTCVSPVDYGDLEEGRHRFEVRAHDAAGNDNARGYVWIVAFRPPAPTIGARPPGMTTSDSASFGFSDAEPGASFECSLDAGAYELCSTPQAYEALPDGVHSFRVRALDAGGAASAATSAGWTIDSTPPEPAAITGGPPDPSGTDEATFTFTGEPAPAPPGDGAALPPRLPPSTGQTFYVAPTGSDANAGTETAPWQTVQRALNVLQPGQRALVRAGTYVESLTMNRSGTPTDPITLEAYPGERPVITAADTHTLVIRTAASYFRLRGLVLERSPSLGGGNIDVYGHHLEIADNEIRLGTDQGIYLDEPSHHVQILGNWIHHNGQGLIHQSHGIYLQGEDHVVAGNLIHDQPFGFGIQAYDELRRAIIAHNTVARSGHSGIVLGGFPGAQDVQVLNNVFAFNNRHGIAVDSYPPAFSRAEHNVLFGNGDGPIEPGSSGIHFAANLTSDPLFVDPDASNFRLRSGTPARGQGLAGYAPSLDFDGRPRSLGGAPDIGAFEVDAGLECLLDGGAFTPCTSPHAFIGLADGTHSFVVRTVDDAGNAGPAPAYGWRIATQPPSVSITSGPLDWSNEAAPSFSFVADEPAGEYECRLDDVAFSPCTSPQSYSALSEGPHTFSVRATDLDGNLGLPTERSWQIDLVAPPAPTIESAPPDPTAGATASFGFTDSESGVGFRCALDGGAFADCLSPHVYGGLTDGRHTFRLVARDPAGNLSAEASYGWLVDTTGPTTTITSRPSNPSNVATASFGFTANEPGSVFACRLDDGSFVVCSSPQAYSSLPEGSHTFTVRATDPLGNSGAAIAYTWTINSAGPSVTGAAWSGLNNASSITIATPPETMHGHLLLALIGHQGGTARNLVAPSGWAPVPSGDYAQGTNARIRAFFRIADAFEPFSYAFVLTGGSGQDISGGILAVSGVSTAAPIGASLGQVNALSSRSVVAPSIAPSVGNTLLVYAAAASIAGTFTPPAAMTEQFDVATSGAYRITTEAAVQLLPASGPTGTRTGQLSSSSRSVALSIPLAP